MSEKHKKAISKATIGRNISKEQRKNISNTLKDRKLDKEHKQKISLSLKGKKRSIEVRNKMSGEYHWNWKGGISNIKKSIRHIPEYIQWRSDIFERDNWTCQTCGKRGTYLEAHHIKELIKIVLENNILTVNDAKRCQEIWNTNNGTTLCKDCHNLTKYGRPKRCK